MKIVEAKRKGQTDPVRSISYNCSDFPEVKFENKQQYIIVYENGITVGFKCTRGRKTLYSGAIPDGVEIECVERGPNPKKVFHRIKNIVVDMPRSNRAGY